MSDPTVSDSPVPRRPPCQVRGFVGHIESLGRSFRDVAEELAARPELDPEGWGGAYVRDPWPRPLPADLPDATRARLRQHYLAQRPDRVRSLTFVTRQSQSLVALEDHEGALVLALTYDAERNLAEAANAAERAASETTAEPSEPLRELPADLPADVRAAVSGLSFVGATTLLAQLFTAEPGRAGGGDRVTMLLGLAALWHDDLRLAETLGWLARLKADDWALRAAGIAVARRQGYQLLLHELWAGETDPELHAELTALITGEPVSRAEAAGA